MDLSISEKFHSSNNILEVDKQSELELHQEVYKIAKYFYKELDYDRIPYSKFGIFGNKEVKALLFTQKILDKKESNITLYRIYGACSFSKMKFKNDKYHWELEWIWFHPLFRNKGNLKKNWIILEEKFSDFIIKQPLSNDMHHFLKKINSKYKHLVR